MQTVRLHVAGDGVTWAMAKCSMCGEIYKYRVIEASVGILRCRGCGLPMDMQLAIMEAHRLGGEEVGEGTSEGSDKVRSIDP